MKERWLDQVKYQRQIDIPAVAFVGAPTAAQRNGMVYEFASFLLPYVAFTHGFIRIEQYIDGS